MCKGKIIVTITVLFFELAIELKKEVASRPLGRFQMWDRCRRMDAD